MAKSCFPLLTWLLVAAGYVSAQVSAPETTGEQIQPYTPLTLSENYLYSLGQIFTVPRLFQVAAHAAISQLRDHADGWGSGAGAYEVRSASWFGHAFVRENVAFGIRALDGEDPRYTRLGQGRTWTRIRYAIGHTFAVHSRDGEYMPAYSLFANYAMPFIAQEWHPYPIHLGREFGGGTIGVGSVVTSNIGREFWPDVKKKLQRRPAFQRLFNRIDPI